MIKSEVVSDIDPFLDGQALQNCKKCQLPIYEGHAYELGDDRWHINCFKCSKCNSSLGCNSNFLVLGNGNLICSNCSYNCKQCGKKIDDLAILTGDQAYCSSCFKCRACKQKIEDLRYARTSKGLFCMNCHEKLMAKKKKYDLKKKRSSLKDKDTNKENVKEAPLKASDLGTPLLSEIEEDEKPLHHGKPYNSSIHSQSDFYDLYDRSRSVTPKLSSKHSSSHEFETTRPSSALSKDKDLPSTPELNKKPGKSPLPQFETIGDQGSQVETQAQTQQEQQQRESSTLYHPVPQRTSPSKNAGIEREFSIEEINDSDDELSKRHKEPSEPKQLLQPAVNLNQTVNQTLKPEDSPNVSHTKFQGKNLLILSPSQPTQDDKQLNSPESVAFDSNSLYVDYETAKSRSNCPSPLAKANRHARVMEDTDDNQNGINQEQIDLDIERRPNSPLPDPNSEFTTPKKRNAHQPLSNNLSSPPPRAPLPSVPSLPSTPNGRRNSLTSDTYFIEKAINNDDFLNGLGLEGVDYNELNDLKKRNAIRTKPNSGPTASVTNLEEDVQPQVSRKQSILRTPKINLRHKRSFSGGSANSSMGKLNFFKSKEEKGHSRHVSDGSISGGGHTLNNGYFTNTIISPGFTAVLPNHSRSASETSYVNHKNFEFLDHENLNAQTDFELKSIKFEIANLESRKAGLSTDVKKLQEEKLKLTEDIEILRLKHADEYKKLNQVAKEVEKKKNQDGVSKSSIEDSSTVSAQTPTQYQLNISHQASNSSSSLLNGVTDVADDNIETQKATKLKFWRRAKIGFNNISGPTLVVPNGAPGSSEEENKKGFGIMTKSRSTNLLDSFLNVTSSENGGTGISSSKEDESLLFKCSIERRSQFEGTEIPLIITRCLKEVEERGLDMEGIYRISGGNSTILAIEQAFTNVNPRIQDEKSASKLEEVLDCDINAITSALKRYLRKIPDPLIPFELYDDFIKLGSIQSIEKKTTDFKSVIDRLPASNRQVLHKLCNHLELVNSHSNLNRMNYKNLSVVFAPTIARDLTGEREMMDMGHRNDLTEFLLNNFSEMFE